VDIECDEEAPHERKDAESGTACRCVLAQGNSERVFDGREPRMMVVGDANPKSPGQIRGDDEGCHPATARVGAVSAARLLRAGGVFLLRR
jgi:hypothetical protein